MRELIARSNISMNLHILVLLYDAVVRVSWIGEVATVAFKYAGMPNQAIVIWVTITRQKDRIGWHLCWRFIRHASQVALLRGVIEQ